jgi:hypothetical protein
LTKEIGGDIDDLMNFDRSTDSGFKGMIHSEKYRIEGEAVVLPRSVE